MKETSLKAYHESRNFVGSHHKRILSVLETPMMSSEIGMLCGLTTLQVLRRMSELERQGKVVCCGTNGGKYSIYKKIDVIALNNIFKNKAKERKTKRVLKMLLNDSDAIDVLIKSCFLDSYELFIKGYSNEEIKHEIINIIKRQIK